MRRMSIVFIALGAFLPAAATAAGPGDSVEGGGQVAISSSDLDRAGDTLTFQANLTPQGISGNVQYLETSRASEGGPAKWHGTVTCLSVEGNRATIGGFISETQGTDASGQFTLRVVDNGTPAEGADLIQLDYGDDTTACEEPGSDELALARGNATVRDN